MTEPEHSHNDIPAPTAQNDSREAGPEEGSEPQKPEIPERPYKHDFENENDSQKPSGGGAFDRTPPPGMWRMLIFMTIMGMMVWYFLGSSREAATQVDYGFFLKQLEADNVESVLIQNGTRVLGEFRKETFVPSNAKDPDAKGSSPDKSPLPEKDAESTRDAEPQGTEAKKKPESGEKPSPGKGAKDGEGDRDGKDGKDVKKFITFLPSPIEAGGELDRRLHTAVGERYQVKEPVDTGAYLMILSIIIMVVLLGSIWLQFRRARDQMNGQMSDFSRSHARRFHGGSDKVTFQDVAGLEGVKEDLAEVVDFLMNPKKFERLGARIPKGILMCGPPGTGKTLLARAIAGEADVAFYSINASEFIQMFVGVGASRVRDMFDVARRNAPAILFIDEIDAVGRLRGTGIGGGNDEREQTLNQILSEMDGFATNDVVIVIAATNRPDVLDPALLRPGRFDRHVTVPRPAQKGRVMLFEVHTRKVPLAGDVDCERLASMTTGLTGADIRNIVNEAALWACRHNKDAVAMSDFYYAIDKVLMGAKREEVISEDEKRLTAYHEAGHTIMAWLTPGRDQISKVSIIPRGRALGVTQLIADEDRVSITQSELEGKLLVSLGGRAAEKLVFNDVTAGAESDLRYVTQLAQNMVSAWGMSPRIGPAAFHMGEEHPFLGKEMSTQRNFSDKTAQVIDEEVMRILNEAAEKVENTLAEHRNMLDALAQALEIREELDEAQIEQIIGPPRYRKKRDSGGEATPTE